MKPCGVGEGRKFSFSNSFLTLLDFRFQNHLRIYVVLQKLIPNKETL